MTYDTVMNPIATMSSDAVRTREDRDNAAVGAQLKQQMQMQDYAAPRIEEARVQGMGDAAAIMLAQIDAMRQQPQAPQQAYAEPSQDQAMGLAGYFNEQEGMYI